MKSFTKFNQKLINKDSGMARTKQTAKIPIKKGNVFIIKSKFKVVDSEGSNIVNIQTPKNGEIMTPLKRKAPNENSTDTIKQQKTEENIIHEVEEKEPDVELDTNRLVISN